jgi:glycosyltransferase involved in cell wall biosynthesis/2-polyprenyl-3-methyl-5-hydroxy-6-metoxy-1,4-benzoquinol methylase
VNLPERWPSMGIVLPVYNEAATIERAVETVAGVAERYSGPACVIAVDDGSTDDSAAILADATARLPRLELVRQRPNAGYGAALRAGARRAQELGLAYVTFMDADLTNPPDDVLKIGALAAAGHDYIKASRFLAGGRMVGVPATRMLFSRTGNLVASVLYGGGLTDPTNGFRGMRTELATRWSQTERGFASIVEELDWALRDGVQPVEFPTVLTSRTADQRGSAFGYTPRVIAAYLRYPLRTRLWRLGSGRRRRSAITPMPCPVCNQRAWRPLYRRLGWDFVRCSGCGLRRLDPLPSEQELVNHYARRAQSGNYEPRRASERDAGLQQVLDFAESCGARSGRLFDVGCFDGGLLDQAARRGWDCWGLELQGEAAAEAARRHPGRVSQTSLEEFEGIEPGVYDLVTAVGLVEHLRDPSRLFALAAEGLRSGGLLVIQTPDASSLPARVLGRYWPPLAPPEHTFYFDRSTLERACRAAGMEPVAAHAHVKRLRVGYAYDQFAHFGPEFHRLLRPVVRALPNRALQARVPLYGGEMLFAARRP